MCEKIKGEDGMGQEITELTDAEVKFGNEFIQYFLGVIGEYCKKTNTIIVDDEAYNPDANIIRSNVCEHYECTLPVNLC